MARATPKRPTPRALDTTAAAEPASPARENAQPHFIARLVPLDPGFYAFSLVAQTRWREPGVGLALPAIHVCAPPHHEGDAIEITDSFGRAGSGLAGTWLGGRCNMLFVQSPASGGAALVTAYLARDPDSAPLELDIRRVGTPGGAPLTAAGGNLGAELAGNARAAPLAPLMRLTMGEPASGERAPQRVSLDVVAHIRGRGDVRFADAPWVGRLGPGEWIEALTIVPRDRLAAAAIEYKGLTASGAETSWLGSGSPCGTQGRSIPLIGFAVRQKATESGAQFDCEYTGYFQSGATAGPARNGAPCRSAHDNDPLEGMQLRITPRPTHPAAITTA
jgi:hypothetical protein